MLLLTWWLVAAASGPGYFDYVHVIMGSWIGRVILLGFTASLYFHLCNGIRHLAWDIGFGFEIGTMQKSGWLVVVAAGVLTVDGASWSAGVSTVDGASWTAGVSTVDGVSWTTGVSTADGAW